MEYLVKPTDSVDPNRPFSKWGGADVVGLRPGKVITDVFPEHGEEDVPIIPGLHHGLGDEVSCWEALSGALYDLYQTDWGANLKEGDTFVCEGTGWRFQCVSVHVIPVDPPTHLVEESNRRQKKRDEEERRYKGIWY